MTEQTKNQRKPEGRRQRRIARRRQRILEAAARIFARKSYANTTTKEIADEADVAEGTLYNYFGGKREILLAITGESEVLAESVLLEAEGLDDREAIIRMFVKALDVLEERLPFIRTLFTEAWVDDEIFQEFVVGRLGRVHQQLTTYIAERVAAGAFRPVDTALCAQMILGMFGALLLPSLRGIAPLPPSEERRALAETMVDLLLDGIRVQDA